MILMNQVLDQMMRVDHRGNPVPFSIQFCTLNKKKKEGGQLITVDKAILSWNTGGATTPKNDQPTKANVAGKKPNHYRNRTRNLVLPNNEIRKVHISLITEFNGQEVI
ncbi:MAG: hypothetical protein JXR07_20525 [Reichenbachiella sp.]